MPEQPPAKCAQLCLTFLCNFQPLDTSQSIEWIPLNGVLTLWNFENVENCFQPIILSHTILTLEALICLESFVDTANVLLLISLEGLFERAGKVTSLFSRFDLKLLEKIYTFNILFWYET